MLLKGGAKLSRALVQSLICNRMQVESMDYVFDIAGTWGSNIPMSSMAAILQEACRLYGDNIQLVYDEMDQVKFEDWISFPDSMYADNEIEELFTKANFLPLPHSSCIYNDMAKAISKWPKIFSLAKANGWILEDEDRDEVFRCILKNVGQDPQEIAENAKGLSKDPDLWISKTVASEVIKRMFEHPVGLTSHSNSVSSPNELVSTPYKALLLLDRRGDLRFPLEEVVKDTLIPLGFQLNHDFKAQVLFRLSEDFPIINAMAGWPMVGSVFSLDSKGNGLSMDEIHERLKNIEVKEDYILKALVKNSAQKATPLLYARKYLGGFDEKRFLEERLLPQLIEQPYKGKLLLSLNKEVDGFEELLEKEIIKQGETIVPFTYTCTCYVEICCFCQPDRMFLFLTPILSHSLDRLLHSDRF
ncbi:hypothetical protein IE53DRAFT_8153 [Violaceomyces palustris]|uniref:Uncharacterized protein n=1 Tax=Violaceomyces palustris TaxID=1673888 RepID=A0ACD0P2S6_9BASI|nr:hypothetical protein IE53DRAFT_8153 [Violaceomyces palustris]